jgi:hypothetical protein
VQFFQSPFLYSVPNEPQHKTDNNFQQATEWTQYAGNVR